MTPPIDDDEPSLWQAVVGGCGVLAGCAVVVVASICAALAAILFTVRWATQWW